MKGKMMSEQVFKGVLTKYLSWLWLIFFPSFFWGFPFSSSFVEASTWLRTVWFLLWVIAGQPTESGLQPDRGEEVWAGQLPAEHRAIGQPHGCCGMHNKSCESSRGLTECPSLALSHLTLLSAIPCVYGKGRQIFFERDTHRIQLAVGIYGLQPVLMLESVWENKASPLVSCWAAFGPPVQGSSSVEQSPWWRGTVLAQGQCLGEISHESEWVRNITFQVQTLSWVSWPPSFWVFLRFPELHLQSMQMLCKADECTCMQMKTVLAYPVSFHLASMGTETLPSFMQCGHA